MSVLVWLLGIPLSAVLAACWGAWRSRPTGPQDPSDSVAAYERFRAAMQPPVDRDS